MAGLLRNKVVAITGSSTGIGRATAIACAQQGARLVLHHIGDSTSEKDIKILGKEIDSIAEWTRFATGERRHVAVGTDITAPDAGERIVGTATETFGEINTLVNNAGICKFEDFHDVSKEVLDRHLAVNFTSLYMVTQAATKQMVKQGTGGSVVSLSSITAHMAAKQLTHYAPTKAAILGMNISCAAALGQYGIRFNAVCPGTTETAMNKEDLDKENKRSELAAKVPLGRLGKPDDIAGVIVFLASDLAKYVTAQWLLVDGGAAIYYQ